ncbi:MAG: hypothetical protein J0M29_09025 [Chitinophagales bacterium]|nr:hypothetical protein [Chitinophagales bacterium]
MKNRKQRRILRRTIREYQQLIGEGVPPVPTFLPPPTKPGEMFQKFTLYNENRRTYTDIKTEYIG